MISTQRQSKLIVKRNETPFWRLFSSASDAAAADFDSYVKVSKTLKEDPGNETKLKMYALYKQSTIGTNNTPKPGAMDIVGKYKWAAWSNLGTMTKEDAQKEYIELVKKLVNEIGTN